MKFFTKKRGQALIYFLCIATLIAMVWASIFKSRMDQMNRSLRTRYVTELNAECEFNSAACRIAKTNAEIYGASGEIQVKVRAIKNLVKVMDKIYLFSPRGRVQWVDQKNRVDALGLLKTDTDEATVDPGMADDILQLCRDIQIFLVKVQAHDNNFDF
jgi:hypothetical protein